MHTDEELERMGTSKAALTSISDVRGKLKRRVFEAIKARKKSGATCDELEDELDLKHQTLSARVRELWQEGFLRRLRGWRRTRSGRWATVYVVRKYRLIRKPRSRCSRCGQVLTTSPRTM